MFFGIMQRWISLRPFGWKQMKGYLKVRTKDEVSRDNINLLAALWGFLPQKEFKDIKIYVFLITYTLELT